MNLAVIRVYSNSLELIPQVFIIHGFGEGEVKGETSSSTKTDGRKTEKDCNIYQSPNMRQNNEIQTEKYFHISRYYSKYFNQLQTEQFITLVRIYVYQKRYINIETIVCAALCIPRTDTEALPETRILQYNISKRCNGLE